MCADFVVGYVCVCLRACLRACGLLYSYFLILFNSLLARERTAKSLEITAWSDLEDITQADPKGFAFLLINKVLKRDQECSRRICDILALKRPLAEV